MKTNVTQTFSLAEDYIWLNDEGLAIPAHNDQNFWENLAAGRTESHRYLMTKCHLTGDFPHWEKHPNGDEVVTLLSGHATLVCLQNEEEHKTILNENDTVIVPKGVWHRLIVPKEARLLVITAGEGTEHRPIE